MFFIIMFFVLESKGYINYVGIKYKGSVLYVWGVGVVIGKEDSICCERKERVRFSKTLIFDRNWGV